MKYLLFMFAAVFSLTTASAQTAAPKQSSAPAPIEKGKKVGDISYWDGAKWTPVASGKPGQYLQLSNANVPQWTGIYAPTVITGSVTNIKITSAMLNGALTDNGGDDAAIFGFCWSKNPNPTLADNHVEPTISHGTYKATLGLSENTEYYVRAYATNKLGTFYGTQQSFKTWDGPRELGNEYVRGTVFYFLKPGDPGYDANKAHGFVFSSFQGSSKAWGTSILVGANGSAVGTGKANTAAIEAARTVTNNILDPRISRDSGVDWFVPSKDEMALLVQYQGLPLTPDAWYWTSTEVSADSAVAYSVAKKSFVTVGKKANDSRPYFLIRGF